VTAVTTYGASVKTDTTTDTEQALADLGVDENTLTAQERAALDTDGYLIFPGVVDADWLEQLRARLSELQQQEGGAAGYQVRQPGADWLADLLNKGVVFERMLRERKMLAAIHHVLGQFHVHSLNFRSARPGEGHQALHTDCDALTPDGKFKVCNSMWLVDDFTADNGATRVVPGSHRTGTRPDQVLADPEADHPDQILLTAPAGSIVIFNSHLWHGGTLNRTEAPRRGMTFAFSRRDQRQQLNQAEYIRKAVYDRLSPAERYLMEV
jgi:ectoine hydroxylase-related dioxygenase (phytanoyl-CoA dioxygenase family)